MSTKSSTTTLTISSSFSNQRPPPYYPTRDDVEENRRYRFVFRVIFVVFTLACIVSTGITNIEYFKKMENNLNLANQTRQEAHKSFPSQIHLKIFLSIVIQILVHLLGFLAVGVFDNTFIDVEYCAEEGVENVHICFIYLGSMFVICSMASIGLLPMSITDYFFHLSLLAICSGIIYLAVRQEPILLNPVRVNLV